MPRSKDSEVIDLTASPLPEVIVLQSDDDASIEGVSPSPQERQEKEKRKTRRKKRKRTVVEEGGPGTREGSVEAEETKGGPSRRRERRERSPNGDHPSEHRERRQRQRSTDYNPRDPNLRSRHRSHSPRPSNDDSTLFYVDVTPAALALAAKFPAITAPMQENETSTLLLPAHVSVFGTTPIEILPPSALDSDEEDYIEYLDYDDRKNLIRYFDNPEEEEALPLRTVCKNCGAEGKHFTAACPVLICLTCGARDEHSTRGCPISKTCFSCGMKGHISSNCPNRHSSRGKNKYDDCDRCGSRLHKMNECPTLWRLYEYLADDEKEKIIRARQAKRKLALGQGGEGYIAGDEWCYNCGNCGHWGDDCNELLHPIDFPREPSAFSAYNTMSGPFFDHLAEPIIPSSRRREPREWEQSNPLPEDWGNYAPENVGKQGRRKDRAEMEKRAKEQEVDDDPDDWFGNPKNARNRGIVPPSSRRGSGSSKALPTGPKKLSFGSSLKGAGKQFQPVPSTPPSLLERLGPDTTGSSRKRHNTQNRDSNSLPRSKHDRRHNFYNHQRDSGQGRERDRDKYRRRDEPGPRYNGGYSR